MIPVQKIRRILAYTVFRKDGIQSSDDGVGRFYIYADAGRWPLNLLLVLNIWGI